VTNIGADTLNITSMSTSGDFAETTSCGTTLTAGSSCAVAVTFVPTVTGVRTGALTIVDDAAGSPHTVNLTGTGQSAPTTSIGTPTGDYSVTISGSAGTLTQSAVVTLSVQ